MKRFPVVMIAVTAAGCDLRPASFEAFNRLYVGVSTRTQSVTVALEPPEEDCPTFGAGLTGSINAAPVEVTRQGGWLHVGGPFSAPAQRLCNTPVFGAPVAVAPEEPVVIALQDGAGQEVHVEFVQPRVPEIVLITPSDQVLRVGDSFEGFLELHGVPATMNQNGVSRTGAAAFVAEINLDPSWHFAGAIKDDPFWRGTTTGLYIDGFVQQPGVSLCVGVPACETATWQAATREWTVQ